MQARERFYKGLYKPSEEDGQGGNRFRLSELGTFDTAKARYTKESKGEILVHL